MPRHDARARDGDGDGDGDGDEIELDVDAGALTLHVTDVELQRRRAAWTPPEPHHDRGYGALFLEHVTQADRGCDFDFLRGPASTPRPTISY